MASVLWLPLAAVVVVLGAFAYLHPERASALADPMVDPDRHWSSGDAYAAQYRLRGLAGIGLGLSLFVLYIIA